jgi:hypothetical protein
MTVGSAKKVQASAQAAQFLHTDVAIQQGNWVLQRWYQCFERIVEGEDSRMWDDPGESVKGGTETNHIAALLDADNTLSLLEN